MTFLVEIENNFFGKISMKAISRNSRFLFRMWGKKSNFNCWFLWGVIAFNFVKIGALKKEYQIKWFLHIKFQFLLLLASNSNPRTSLGDTRDTCSQKVKNIQVEVFPVIWRQCFVCRQRLIHNSSHILKKKFLQFYNPKSLVNTWKHDSLQISLRLVSEIQFFI